MRTGEVQGTAWSEWPAPAKLNLMLRVVGRRDDGYHRLQTVFQLLDWGDTIRIRARSDRRIERVGGHPAVAADADLTVRAARALQALAGDVPGVDIEVRKRVPIGGGFGGGSSDAATVLCALDRLWGLDLGEQRLAGIGLLLGADVPVFVRGCSAWAEGLGEVLTPLELGARWYVLVDTGAHVGTGDLFQTPDLTRDASPVTISDFVSGRCVENVFQPLVAAREPRVAQALGDLSRFGAARLTGTGGGCFVALDSRDAAQAARQQLKARWSVQVARGIDRSPLLDAVASAGTWTTGASPSG